MIGVVCISNLHPFEVDPRQTEASCPECGDTHFRRAGRHGSMDEVPDANVDAPRLTIETLEGRHRVGGDTWLDSRERFVNMVKSREPGMTDRELSACVTAWFGPKGDRDGN